jgi:ribosome-associated heat shock protein Hsp15
MSKLPSPELIELRVDVWLWAARFFKTRSLAKQAIEGGRVEINDSPCKPAKTLRPGDRLRIGRGEERLAVDVLALSAQRGPAPVAQSLYQETEASRLAREAAREQRRLVGSTGPLRRPDKHARQKLRRMKDSR